jgi:hypothetical protein
MHAPISAADKTGTELWAITSYFNPARWRRRLSNYRVFRDRLRVPLVAVELAYGPDFELSDDDAEILVRLRGGDVMWQKERLLNVALRALPHDCRKVICVDCDIIFGTTDWPETVSRLLDRYMILQPFRHVHHLPQDWKPVEPTSSAAAFSQESVAFCVASGTSPAALLSEIPRDGSFRSRGFTWAARRELFDRHEFYDACIVGGGDLALGCGTYGCFDSIVNFHRMNSRQRERYLAWAEPFHRTVGTAAGWMEGDIYHLWHGDIRDRRYPERHKMLPSFEFDPFEDIVIDGRGCWRWNSDKPQMHACVREYFASRKEDG